MYITPIVCVCLLIWMILRLAVEKNATVIVTTITGIMVGALYNCDIWEEEDVKEHTVQICLLFVTFTIQWDQQIGSTK